MIDKVTIGDCTLYHGDCREILPTLGKFDACITDPPYVLQLGGGRGIGSGQAVYAKDGSLAPMANFDLGAYAEHMLSAANCLVAFHSRLQLYDYASLARVKGLSFDLHVWHKPDAIPFAKGVFRPDFEYIAVMYRKARIANLPSIEKSKLYSGSSPPRDGHPTPKPLPLMAKYVRLVGGESVIDPFMGSGTTGVACVQLGRKFTGIEIERKYFDIACERIERALAQGVLIPRDTKPVQQALEVV